MTLPTDRGDREHKKFREPGGTGGTVAVAVVNADNSAIGTGAVIGALPAGTNNIGDVDVASIAAGANHIGQVGNEVYNGATWDNERGNVEGTLLAAAERTTTQTGADQTNHNGGPLRVVVNVSAVSGSAALVVYIQIKDPASGTYPTLLTSASLASVARTALEIFPGATPTANLVVNSFVGRTWRIYVEHATADPISYSVGYQIGRG